MLVVEDDSVNQKLARPLLYERGHQVMVAVNGRAAVAAVARKDVQMPHVDGLEATRLIRKRGSGCR